MRFVLFPGLKKGMDARDQQHPGAHEGADAMRAAARTEVADYEAQLAGIRAEAAQHRRGGPADGGGASVRLGRRGRTRG